MTIERTESDVDPASYEEAIVIFQRMIWCDPQDNIGSYNLACSYALLGRREPALRYLRHAIRLGYRDHRHMHADRDLDLLRGDVRYERLRARMILAEETLLELDVFGWP